MSDLVKKPEAARTLGISLSTLNHWVTIRRISFYRIGRLIFFKASDLERFIEQARVTPKGQTERELTQ